jgi:hypothetical protein
MEAAHHLPNAEIETAEVLAGGLQALEDPQAREALYAAFLQPRAR